MLARCDVRRLEWERGASARGIAGAGAEKVFSPAPTFPWPNRARDGERSLPRGAFGSR